MDLDTRTFELLEAIAADGTLTAAARRLHVSQPALSQRLTGLEARLGVLLFDREGRRLVPTRAGRRMIHASSAVLAELRATQRDLDDIRHGRSAVLRFASQCSTNYQWLPSVMPAFSRRSPGVELRVDSAAEDDVIEALLTDRVDVVLACKSDRRAEAVEHRPLFQDEMVAVVPSEHEWAGRPHLVPSDLDDVTLVVFDSYDPGRIPALPLPIPEGSTPARVITTPVVAELLVELVVANQGVGVLPSWVAEPYVASGRVAAVSLTAEAEIRTWYAAWRKGDTPSYIAAFVDELGAHFAAV